MQIFNRMNRRTRAWISFSVQFVGGFIIGLFAPSGWPLLWSLVALVAVSITQYTMGVLDGLNDV